MKSTRRNRWKKRNSFKGSTFETSRLRITVSPEEEQQRKRPELVLCDTDTEEGYMYLGYAIFEKFGFPRKTLYDMHFTIYLDPVTGKVWKIKKHSYIRFLGRFFEHFVQKHRKEIKEQMGVVEIEPQKCSCIRIRRKKNGAFKKISIAA